MIRIVIPPTCSTCSYLLFSLFVVRYYIVFPPIVTPLPITPRRFFLGIPIFRSPPLHFPRLFFHSGCRWPVLIGVPPCPPTPRFHIPRGTPIAFPFSFHSPIHIHMRVPGIRSFRHSTSVNMRTARLIVLLFTRQYFFIV